MNKTLAIIGSGHLGQQIAHYAISDGHYKKVVFFDDYSTEKYINGFEILGPINEVETFFSKGHFNELLIGIGYKHLEFKKELFERYSSLVPFGGILHSTVWVDPTSEIRPGCVIYPGCLIDANSVIDSNTILNIGCSIAHDTIIGKHCFLSPRVAVAGFVEVSEQCFIGINTTIIDNLKIVSKVQIGGGGVVIRNIETAGLYVGNPVRPVK